jgi:hypothetical protein
MATDKADGAARQDLASRIAECIAEADAHGIHVVAAHLDTALNALQGSGLKPSNSELRPRRPLH